MTSSNPLDRRCRLPSEVLVDEHPSVGGRRVLGALHRQLLALGGLAEDVEVFPHKAEEYREETEVHGVLWVESTVVLHQRALPLGATELTHCDDRSTLTDGYCVDHAPVACRQVQVDGGVVRGSVQLRRGPGHMVHGLDALADDAEQTIAGDLVDPPMPLVFLEPGCALLRDGQVGAQDEVQGNRLGGKELLEALHKHVQEHHRILTRHVIVEEVQKHLAALVVGSLLLAHRANLQHL
mmetsp:Transcript_16583/g.37485  ORF Transcript_16583/g.37485 Transcript_16583/m.37485 type:complete len:238 (-) Transcript_16583:1755-2468(-)